MYIFPPITKHLAFHNKEQYLYIYLRPQLYQTLKHVRYDNWVQFYVTISTLLPNTHFKQLPNIIPKAKYYDLMHYDMVLHECICVQFYVPLSTLSPNTLYKLSTLLPNKCIMLHPWPNISTKSLVKSVKTIEHKCLLPGIQSGIQSLIKSCTLASV